MNKTTPSFDCAMSIFAALQRRVADMAAIHRETPQRAQYRALFDAAGSLENTRITVTYLKNDGTIRVCHCTSLGPDSDTTARYVTVWDVEAQGYRRVALDSILSLVITA